MTLDVGVALDDFLNLSPQTLSFGRGRFVGQDEITQVGGRDERLGSDGGIDVMQSLLLSKLSERDLNEFLDFGRFNGAFIELLTGIGNGDENGSNT